MKQVLNKMNVEKLWAMQDKIAFKAMQVQYDDNVAGFKIMTEGGLKFAMVGDSIPACVMQLAVANEGKWVSMAGGN